jgi:hypothetical protein
MPVPLHGTYTVEDYPDRVYRFFAKFEDVSAVWLLSVETESGLFSVIGRTRQIISGGAG